MRVKELRRFTGPIVVAYLGLCIFAASLLYANHTARQTGMKFCDSIRVVVDYYKTAPEPPSDAGKKFKQSYIRLYRDLGCK